MEVFFNFRSSLEAGTRRRSGGGVGISAQIRWGDVTQHQQ